MGFALWAGCCTVSAADWKTFSFPEVEGWKQAGEIQVFSPETLYEYIDGGADIYLKYDFDELKVAEYGPQESNDRKASLTVEVYRHRNADDAFGIYSQERLPGADTLPIGAEGYRDNELLNFLTGPYYVKISSFNLEPGKQVVMESLARKVSENLGEKSALPSILSAFPKEGRKEKSQTFILKNFLGYPFLNSSFTSEYELSGRNFKLFVMECTDDDEPKQVLNKYLAQVGKGGTEIKEGRHTISDPHHGEVELCWKGRYLFGTLDLKDPSLLEKYLTLFEEKLRERK
jgi:hypothetical protein